MMVERWVFNVVLVYLGLAYWGVMLYTRELWAIGYLILLFYLVYLICDVLQVCLLLYYSDQKMKDVKLAAISPLMPVYYAYQKIVTLIAITEELLFRKSFQSNFVPERVRNATWHW
jgi:biofilm PGA synthesis N-glycosyltransferase PgaC